jgi:hypothetical protein
MNNQELNKILASAQVPERPAEFWDEFPRRLMDEVRSADASVRAKSAAPDVSSPIARPATAFALATWLWRGAFAAGLALLCLFVGFKIGVGHRPTSLSEAQQFAVAQKYFRELQALFPNQVEAIEFDATGTHLTLAEQADVPMSPPIYVAICGPQGCRRFVTFSGQQVRVNGEVFEVLLDRQGAVLVVGKQWVWPAPNRANPGPYRVEARPLPITS